MKWILIILISYALGNLNGALMISKMMMHDDVRKHGSGNAGLTNFFRTYGGFQSLLVIAIDILKCVAACIIAAAILPDQALHAKMVAGVATIIGHSYPAAAGFRGGKGILCGLAMALSVDLRIAGIIFTLFVVIVAWTRYVSLGSILAALTFAACFLLLYWGDWFVCILAIAAAAFVVYRHRGNLMRLLKGTESKLSFHKKK